MHVLRQKGYTKISCNRVSRLMKQIDIKSITIRKFKNYRSKQHRISCQNLINRQFQASMPNEIWLSDITYIHTVKHGWTYLASVLDVCTRKIVGYSYGRKMDRKKVVPLIIRPWNHFMLLLKKNRFI